MDDRSLYRYLGLAEKLCRWSSILLMLSIAALLVFDAPRDLTNGVIFLLVTIGCLLLVVRWGLKA